ncbi:MAG: hypothetical protein ACOYMN_03760 [Roseimicrobium sp.]
MHCSPTPGLPKQPLPNRQSAIGYVLGLPHDNTYSPSKRPFTQPLTHLFA